MSVQAISHVIEHSKQKGNPFVVLLMIANHARSDGSGAWPSVSTLAKESRCSERTVQRAILTLIKSGELSVSCGSGPYGTNLYTVRGVKLSPPGVNLSGRGCQNDGVGVSQVSPNPSLTVPKEKEELFQLISDYNNGVTHEDEHGHRYKISPTTRRRVYANENRIS